MSRWISTLAGILPFLLGWTALATADCNFVSVTDVNFGIYDTLSGSALNSTGSLTVTCTTFDIVTTSIGASPNSGGFNPRRMRNPSTGELLDYNLYRDSSRTQIWGNGTQGTYTTTNIIWYGGGSFTRTIYGRIPGGQDVGVGNYSDLLVITINF